MTPINRDSPEWEAIREYAAARVRSLTLALRERQSLEQIQEKQSRIEELRELVREFSPAEIATFDAGADYDI